MRIALAQIVASTEPDADLDLVREHVARAKDAGAELVVYQGHHGQLHDAVSAWRSRWTGSGPAGVRDAAQTASPSWWASPCGRGQPGPQHAPGGRRGGGAGWTYDKIHLFDA